MSCRSDERAKKNLEQIRWRRKCLIKISEKSIHTDKRREANKSGQQMMIINANRHTRALALHYGFIVHQTGIVCNKSVAIRTNFSFSLIIGTADRSKLYEPKIIKIAQTSFPYCVYRQTVPRHRTKTERKAWRQKRIGYAHAYIKFVDVFDLSFWKIDAIPLIIFTS